MRAGGAWAGCQPVSIMIREAEHGRLLRRWVALAEPAELRCRADAGKDVLKARLAKAAVQALPYLAQGWTVIGSHGVAGEGGGDGRGRSRLGCRDEAPGAVAPGVAEEKVVLVLEIGLPGGTRETRATRLEQEMFKQKV